MAGRTLYAQMTGVKIIPSDRLPMRAHGAEEMRRHVRHGLAGVLQACGEPVGQKPGSPLHLFIVNDDPDGKIRVLCSRAMFALIASGVVGDFYEGKLDL